MDDFYTEPKDSPFLSDTFTVHFLPQRYNVQFQVRCFVSFPPSLILPLLCSITHRKTWRRSCWG